ncbi:MAG: hypothetical protein ABJA67_05055 [Chthonomonadales bacterium]
MSDDQIPVQEVPPPKTGKSGPFKIFACCGIGCLGVIVLLVIGILYSVGKSGDAIHRADLVAQEFIADVDQNQYKKAYALVSLPWSTNISEKTSEETFKLWQKMVGKFGKPKLTGQYWYGGTGGEKVTLGYSLKGSKSAVTVRVVLVSETAGFRLESCNFTPAPKAGPSTE